MSEIIERLKHMLENLSLNAPLPENKVIEFEAKHQITLPSDYREFITKIGNGGDGPPEYGLLQLGELNVNHIPHYLFEGYGDKLKQPFPFTNYWLWDGEEDKPDFEQKFKTTKHGCLCLGDDGCGMYWLLIVTGDSKGQIWQTSEMAVQPCLPRLTFTEWYLNWIDGQTDWWRGYE